MKVLEKAGAIFESNPGLELPGSFVRLLNSHAPFTLIIFLCIIIQKF